MRMFKLVGASVLLLSAGMADAQSTNFESSKVTTGAVVQGSGFDVVKLAPGFVLQNGAFQSAKLSNGFVLEWQNFAASKMSVGIVVRSVPSNGIVVRAPLTHF